MVKIYTLYVLSVFLEDRPPGVGLLDTGPQFQYMPELELDTVFEAGQSQDDVSSDNPTR